MRYAQKYFWKALDRISNLIELLIMCHPQGFKVLLGEVPPPTSREIHEMMNAGRVKMPDDFKPTSRSNETEAERIVYDSEYFEESVKMADGWFYINRGAREFKKSDSRMWSIVVDHVKFVGNASSRYGSKLGYIAVTYGLAPKTVTKYRNEFSQKLARIILMPSEDEEDFYLLPG
ncbi:MAG: hypothetical protein IJQ99_11180 [Synergistaceae bacterium]|nr:hypothetical protein [Synergistaceae bacterium]